MKQTQLCTLVKKSEPVKGIFDFTVEAPAIAAEAEAGQFLHILCGRGVFLRRPISICDVQDGRVRFVFEVKGEGTKELAEFSVGDKIDILGPLGHGFTIDKKYKASAVIGGGIGIFPLLKLSRELYNPLVVLGFRSLDRVMMEEEFRAVSAETLVATDDGSYGYNGYAIELLKKQLSERECDVIYSCGPTPLLKAVQALAAEKNIDCQLSLEQRMGCGIGACLVCTCKTTHKGMDENMRVCKNGPVFDAREVIF